MIIKKVSGNGTGTLVATREAGDFTDEKVVLSNTDGVNKHIVRIPTRLIANQYTVTYDVNDGDTATTPVDDQVYEEGSEITITTEIPEYEGYEFEGWIIKDDSTGKIYQAGDPYIIMSNVELVAQWKVKETSTGEGETPGEGEIPEEGETPEEPSKPSQPNGNRKPGSETTTKSTSPNTSTKVVPKTGDESKLALYVTLLSGSMIFMAALGSKKLRRKGIKK